MILSGEFIKRDDTKQSLDLLHVLAQRIVELALDESTTPPLIVHFSHFVTSLKLLSSTISERLHRSSLITFQNFTETSHLANEEKFRFKQSKY